MPDEFPDGLLSRYTSKLRTPNFGETTRFANDDRTRSARRELRPHRPGMLILSQGKESDRAFEMRHDRMMIGRSQESDIVLDDAAVSRAHAIVTRDATGTYSIYDHDSANGTFVNSQRISEQVLEDGDEIQVGMTVFVFRH